MTKRYFHLQVVKEIVLLSLLLLASIFSLFNKLFIGGLMLLIYLLVNFIFLLINRKIKLIEITKTNNKVYPDVLFTIMLCFLLYVNILERTPKIFLLVLLFVSYGMIKVRNIKQNIKI